MLYNSEVPASHLKSGEQVSMGRLVGSLIELNRSSLQL